MSYEDMSLEYLFAAADEIMSQDIYQEETQEPTLEDLFTEADAIMSQEIYQ